MNLLEYALEYAEAGFAVFPLTEKEKVPLPGSRGVKEATTDPEQIKKWWQGKSYNIGLAVGSPSGIFGIDIDYKDGCDPDFLKELPATVLCKTPTGGHHAYFRLPPGGVKNGKKLETGATVRSDGYYFVLPPSVHPQTGTAYVWQGRGLVDGEIAECPAIVLELADKKESEKLVIPETVEEGERNTTFWKTACSFRSKGLEYPEILAGLIALNERTNPQMSVKEMEDLAKRACNYKKGTKKEKRSESKVYCLGHDGDDYYYTTESNKQIRKVTKSAHNINGFLDLMPLSYWKENYEIEIVKKNGEVTKKVPWGQIASDLMEECRRVGIFNPENVRGLGCWEDDGELVVHLGDRILSNGKYIPLDEFDSRYVYELSAKLKNVNENPLTDSECEYLIKTCELFTWKHRDACKYFLGWLALSRVCGALPWRPHCWLTGPSGSGKSTILETVVKNICGEMGLQPVGNSSEAGIRQAIGRDSIPVLFDEAETSNKKSGMRMQNILELIRQSSSSSDAKIMKGTANQDGMQFKINCLFLLSSIRVNLSEEADKNRFTVLELERHNGSNWKEVEKAIDKITEEFGDRLFARMLRNFDRVIRNKKLLAEEIAKTHGQRIGQQYGTLLAGYVELSGRGELTALEASKFIQGLEISSKDAIEEDHDEVDCLNHLLTQAVVIEIFPTQNGIPSTESASVIREKKTIAQAIHQTITETQNPGSLQLIGKQLELYGIKVEPEGKFLLIAVKHPALQKFYQDTKWDGGGFGLWGSALSRIRGAERGDQVRPRFGSAGRQYAVKLPIDAVLGD